MIVAGILWWALSISACKAWQFHVTDYITSTYLPGYRMKTGTWPSTLAGVEGDLRARIDHSGMTYGERPITAMRAVQLLRMYHDVHPTVTIVRSTEQRLDAVTKISLALW